MLEHLSVCFIPLISLLCCSLSVSLAVSSLYFALSVVSDQSLKLKQWQIHQLSFFLESNHNMDCKECQRGAFDLRCRTMSLWHWWHQCNTEHTLMLLKMPSTSYPSPVNSSKHMCLMVKCSNHITHPFVFFCWICSRFSLFKNDSTVYEGKSSLYWCCFLFDSGEGKRTKNASWWCFWAEEWNCKERCRRAWEGHVTPIQHHLLFHLPCWACFSALDSRVSDEEHAVVAVVDSDWLLTKVCRWCTLMGMKLCRHSLLTLSLTKLWSGPWMKSMQVTLLSLFYLLVPQVAKMAFARSICGLTLVIQLTRDSSNSLCAEFKKEFVDFK